MRKLRQKTLTRTRKKNNSTLLIGECGLRFCASVFPDPDVLSINLSGFQQRHSPDCEFIYGHRTSACHSCAAPFRPGASLGILWDTFLPYIFTCMEMAHQTSGKTGSTGVRRKRAFKWKSHSSGSKKRQPLTKSILGWGAGKLDSKHVRQSGWTVRGG